MNQVREKCRPFRHVLAMLGILLAVVVLFGCVGMVQLPQAASKTKRVIVNDDYSMTTQPITGESGLRQQIQVKAGTTLHGISVNIATFQRTVFGTAHLQLLDAQGQVVASSQADMTKLLDNSFFTFLLDKPVRCDEAQELTLHLYTQPQSEEDVIALWKSKDSYPGFALEENGQPQEGTIALQYIYARVGRDIYGYFLLLMALTVITLEFLYWITFVKKVRLEVLFVAAALLGGLLFTVFTPIGGAPDEYVHMATAYQISNRILGEEVLQEPGAIAVRRCDADRTMNTPVVYDSFDFQKIYRGLFKPEPIDETMVYIRARTAYVFQLQYAPQALGITLARLLHLGYVPMVLLGRLCNLLLYVLLGWLAIRIVPVFRATMTLCALLPMSLQLAGSFSYDTYVLALSFLGIALVLRMAYGEGKVQVRHLVAAAIVFALLAPAKAVYILLAFLIWIVPKEKFSTPRQALMAKAGVLGAVMLFWLAMNLSMILSTLGLTAPEHVPGAAPPADLPLEEMIEAPLADTPPVYPYQSMEQPDETDNPYYDPAGDLLPNGDSMYYYNVSYILHNPGETLRLVIRTIAEQTDKYVHSMLGTRLGEIIVVDLSASWIFGACLILLLLWSVQLPQGQLPVHTGWRKAWGALLFLGIAAATVLVCILWTPINYETIFGIQGRYFLPALPLACMALQTRRVHLEKPADTALVFWVIPIQGMIMLQVLYLMLGC